MERRGSGPQATAGAPQLCSPPDCRGVRNFPDPMTPHHVGPCSHCLLLPPASGRIHPDHPSRGQHKCTIPLRKGGITFWHQTRVIPADSPLERLLQADGATINLANQKNRVKDAKVSHTPSGDPAICPCRSLARLVDALSSLPADLPHCNWNFPGYRPGDSGGSPPRGEVGQPPFSGVRLHPHRHPQPPFRRGHQAMPGRFRLMGRWSSDTYLKYIQPQIVQLVAGAAARMAPPR
jgi:hypothetical protein